MSKTPTYILRCEAPDRIGILADVAGFLALNGLNVLESHDFADLDSKRFFVRIEFEGRDSLDIEALKAGFAELANTMDMLWTIRASNDLPKAVVLVSKGDHCLNDLLYRHRRGRLGVDIVEIISNHTVGKWHADRHDIPFRHIPVSNDNRTAAEADLMARIEATGAQLVILARYMQILSNDLASKLDGRCINIHHSFLPSFKGARPYHQAYERGVKLIGATAHFVTADLDEGPIIAQDVMQVDHRFSASKMADMGKDAEARVLASAVTAFGEGRIFRSGSKTIVFT